MRRTIVAVAFLMASVALAEETAIKDVKDLNGTYSVVVLKKGDEDAPKEFADSMTLEFKNGVLNLIDKGKKDSKSAAIVIMVKDKPVSIDLTPNEGENAGKAILGIVRMVDGHLEMVLADSPGGTRPTEFKSGKDGKTMFIKLKKQ